MTLGSSVDVDWCALRYTARARTTKLVEVLNEHGPDTTGGVHFNNEDLHVNPSDRGTIFRYVSEETFPTHSTATHLVCMIWTLALETRTSLMRLSTQTARLR